jgi:hypothetical protein|tara:strand:+ start:853 stop:1665 length:813 start_codon:yes stop_codon:yes gene_type:complete
MAHRNCFERPNEKLSAGDYLSRKKSKQLYKASVNLAQYGGVYQKNTSIGGIGRYAKKKGNRSNGTYVGDIYIGNGQTVSTPAGGLPQTNGDSKGCLIGAKSYEALLSVTTGKYLVDPINFDFRRDQSIWVGSLYQMDMCGTQTIVSNPQWPVKDSSTNTFKYPLGSSQNQVLPDASNSNVGLIVDYSYNIFYPTNLTQSNRGLCYLKNERAWKQWIKCLPYTRKEAELYFGAAGGYMGDFNYPKKFHFDCNESWINDISLCLTQPRGNGQ